MLHLRGALPDCGRRPGRSCDPARHRTDATSPRVHPGNRGIAAPPTRWSTMIAAPTRSLAASRHRPSTLAARRHAGPGPARRTRHHRRRSRCPTPDVEQLVANATIEPVLVDDDGVPLGVRAPVPRPLSEAGPGGAAARRPVPVRPRTAGSATASRSTTSCPDLGWHRRRRQPRRGVRRPPRRPHPPRPVGAGRQSEPARRPAPRPLRPPHRRRSPPIRPATAERRTTRLTSPPSVSPKTALRDRGARSPAP